MINYLVGNLITYSRSRVTDGSPYFILDMFKIGKLVYAFLKAVGNINLENVLISKEYRPTYNIIFLTHTVRNVSTVTFRILTTGSVEVIGEANDLPVSLGFFVWETN